MKKIVRKFHWDYIRENSIKMLMINKLKNYDVSNVLTVSFKSVPKKLFILHMFNM